MPEVRLAAPVKATPLKNRKAILSGKAKPGSFFIYWGGGAEPGLYWIWFSCPCGCGAPSHLPIGLNMKPAASPGRGATWEWDGNHEEPTLKPSIDHVGHWHGFLTAGFFTQA